MKSIMLNQQDNTFIKFYVLVSKNIYKEQKPIIDKICQEHINCNISYFIINEEFKEFSSSGAINRTTAIFYRLLLQNLLPNEKKIIYFDCDTLIYKDLNKFYNLNIDNNYYLGQYEGKPIKKYGPGLKDFINSGVILINLENLRNDNIYQKMYEFIKKNDKHLLLLDQDVINVVCNKKNGFIPFNYISSGVCNLNKIINLNKNEFNKTKIIKEYAEPYIFHFKIYVKPWQGIAKYRNFICYDFFPRFYEYARKTSYYFEILETFKVFN